MKLSAPSPSRHERQWQAEDDFRTLQRAAEVQSDHRRLSSARKHGEKQLSQMKRVLSGSRR